MIKPALSFALVLAATGIVHLASAATTVATARTGDEAAGLSAWGKVHAVFSHPRCVNCHVGPDGIPVWSGANFKPGPRPHGMDVHGGATRMGVDTGLLCATCHRRENSPLPHGPPGAPVWSLAPPEMQWFGKSSAEICAQTRDPARNGHRTLEQVAHHVETDAVVQWGWNPGPGREPAPGTSAEAAAAIRAWAGAGAPCPAG